MQPGARLNVQIIHSQHLTAVNAAWRILLILAHAVAAKHGVLPDEIMLGTYSLDRLVAEFCAYLRVKLCSHSRGHGASLQIFAWQDGQVCSCARARARIPRQNRWNRQNCIPVCKHEYECSGLGADTRASSSNSGSIDLSRLTRFVYILCCRCWGTVRRLIRMRTIDRVTYTMFEEAVFDIRSFSLL